MLDYDTASGLFTWKKQPRSVRVGAVAGHRSRSGYIQIGLDGRLHYAHRIAWLYVHGYLPEHGIDHINRDRGDNRTKNLREASQVCNLRNCGNPTNNSSGVKGVHFCKLKGKWKAEIMVKYKAIRLGSYGSFEDAVCARLACEQCLGWSGCDSTSPAYLYVKNNIQRSI